MSNEGDGMRKVILEMIERKSVEIGLLSLREVGLMEWIGRECLRRGFVDGYEAGSTTPDIPTANIAFDKLYEQ